VEANGSSQVVNNFLLESNCPTGLYAGNSAVRVMNNTVTGCYNGLYAPTNQSPTIHNNLFYSNTTAILADGMPVLDYNGFWLNGGDFNVPTGTLMGTHNVFANPLFVAPSAGDYHLSPGSQMIDAGTSMGAPTTDYDGDPRPVGIALDIGADEYSLRLLLPLVLR